MPKEIEPWIAALPRRVAHVVHALMEVRNDPSIGPYGPFKPSEIVLYDSEAPSVAATRSALARAQRYGLAIQVGRGLWTASNLALDNRRGFEDRYFSDIDNDALADDQGRAVPLLQGGRVSEPWFASLERIAFPEFERDVQGRPVGCRCGHRYEMCHVVNAARWCGGDGLRAQQIARHALGYADEHGIITPKGQARLDELRAAQDSPPRGYRGCETGGGDGLQENTGAAVATTSEHANSQPRADA